MDNFVPVVVYTPSSVADLANNGLKLITLSYEDWGSAYISVGQAGCFVGRFYENNRNTIGFGICSSSPFTYYTARDVESTFSTYTINTAYSGTNVYFDYPAGGSVSTIVYQLDTGEIFDSEEAMIAAFENLPSSYPITYHYTNSTVSGPSEAAVGDTVTVSAVPNNNYGITDPTTQILVTNNDIPVSYNWNPSTNTITFVMPDPS